MCSGKDRIGDNFINQKVTHENKKYQVRLSRPFILFSIIDFVVVLSSTLINYRLKDLPTLQILGQGRRNETYCIQRTLSNTLNMVILQVLS